MKLHSLRERVYAWGVWGCVTATSLSAQAAPESSPLAQLRDYQDLAWNCLYGLGGAFALLLAWEAWEQIKYRRYMKTNVSVDGEVQPEVPGQVDEEPAKPADSSEKDKVSSTDPSTERAEEAEDPFKALLNKGKSEPEKADRGAKTGYQPTPSGDVVVRRNPPKASKVENSSRPSFDGAATLPVGVSVRDFSGPGGLIGSSAKSGGSSAGLSRLPKGSDSSNIMGPSLTPRSQRQTLETTSPSEHSEVNGSLPVSSASKPLRPSGVRPVGLGLGGSNSQTPGPPPLGAGTLPAVAPASSGAKPAKPSPTVAAPNSEAASADDDPWKRLLGQGGSSLSSRGSGTAPVNRPPQRGSIGLGTATGAGSSSTSSGTGFSKKDDDPWKALLGSSDSKPGSRPSTALKSSGPALSLGGRDKAPRPTTGSGLGSGVSRMPLDIKRGSDRSSDEE